MRRAGGYGQLICFEEAPQQAVAFDCHGRVVQREADTFTCSHCNRVVFVNAKEKPEDVGGVCRLCAGLICCTCVDGPCVPFEEKLAGMERRADTLRSYGF